MSVRKVFLDPEPQISSNTNVPKLDQKLIVGNTVESFVEIQVSYITGSIAVKTVVDFVQKQE